MNGPSYRFRDRVDFQEQGDNCFLVSRYPLKAVRLSEKLRPVFEMINRRGEAGLDELLALVSSDEADLLKNFLWRLVNLGYLEESGNCLGDRLPSLSIVIPVRNRPTDIAECLTSLLRFDYPESLTETIVVDDGSTDETADVISQFGVTLIKNSRRRGASFCRNLGACKARGEIVVFLDSDCTVKKDWGRELIAAFRDPEIVACGGMVDSRENRKALDRYEQVKSSLIMGRVRQDSRDGGRFFYVPSCSLAVRRDVFTSLGGFREEMHVGEDVDLCWRLVDKGHAIAYRPSAVVYHRHRNSIHDFCKRRFDYGTSEPLLQQLHPSRRKDFLLRPGSFVFWAFIVLSLVNPQPVFLLAAAAFLVGDALLYQRKARCSGLSLPYIKVLFSIARVNFSFLYHICAFGSRYYLLPAMAAGFIQPWIAIGFAAGHTVTGLVQYSIHRPRLDPVSFLFFFTLEQASYQAGVWRGCLKRFFWRPVFPRLRFRIVGNQSV